MRHRTDSSALTPRHRSGLTTSKRGSRGVDARLLQLAALLSQVEAGDFTRRTGSVAHDELGSVERAFDAVLQRATEIIGTVQQVLPIFRADRLVVADVNKEMLDSAEMTAGAAYDVGISAGQVSDNISIVAASTEELAATVNEIARHATTAADTAMIAAAQGKAADQGMRALNEAVQKVEGLAQVIAGIAAQTHLLALNATIEAARAGDAGRGFAVVASEVKGLSKATAEATEQVREILEGIQEVSGKASAAIQEISGTMDRISQSTASIASAVVQQGATTQEIGRVSESAAQQAVLISDRVAAVHDRAREIAYIGANNDASKSKDFEILEMALRGVVDEINVGDFVAELHHTEEEVVIDPVERNRKGTSTDGNVTTVLDYVEGDGLDEFSYTGAWLHGDGHENDPGGDAYSCVLGDAVSMRFDGRRIRYFAYADQGQGIALVSVDDAVPVQVDLYSPDRARTMLWDSGELAPGEHTFRLTVSDRKNLDSRYFWISVAKVEIVR